MRQAAKDKGGFGGRTEKKLRLSKEQYGFLEDSFKEHSTVTPVGVLITIWPHFCQKEITCPVVFFEKSPDMLRFKYRIFKKNENNSTIKRNFEYIQLISDSHCRMQALSIIDRNFIFLLIYKQNK